MCRTSRHARLVACALAFVSANAFGCSDDEGSPPRRANATRSIDAGCDSDAAVSGKAAECSATATGDAGPSNLIGAACDSNDDCGMGSCQKAVQVVNTPYPGGYCSAPCRSDAECGGNGVCVPGLRGQMGACYLGCDEANGCSRDGYLCRVVSGIGRCVPGSKPLDEGIAGSACASDGDCGGGPMSCVSMLGALVAPGGYCSQSCAIDSDCGAQGKCINGLGFVTINSGTCYGACEESGDCRSGYECRSVSGVRDEPGVCVPPLETDAGG